MQMKHYANKGGDVEALELYFEVRFCFMFLCFQLEMCGLLRSTYYRHFLSSFTVFAKFSFLHLIFLRYQTTRQAADGSHSTHELIPGGAQVKVNKHNVHSYIHTLANYKLNVEGSEQCRAIRAGFQVY